MSDSIILFSNNCPKCQVLKKKLEQKRIPYGVSEDFETLLKNNLKTLQFGLITMETKIKWI